MKIALITDQHFGVRNDSLTFIEYFAQFYNNTFFPYLENNNIKNIIMLGDTFERRKYTNHITLFHSKKLYFDHLIKYNVFCIVGNHDAAYKNTIEINAPELLLQEYNNIRVISEPSEIEIDGCKIVLMPWMCQDNMSDALQLINETKSQVLMGHLELAGFEMNKGSVMDHGMNSSIFEKFDVVCSGHYHHKSTRGNIHYLGCPYEITWSDYGDQKGFHVFDTDTRELTFIPNPYTMFNKLHYDDSNTDLDQLLNVDFERYRNTYAKIIVHNKNNPYWFDTFVDRLEKVDPAGIQVVEDNLYLNLEDDDSIVSEAQDTLTILKKFIENLDMTVEKKDVERFLGELYSEASNI